MTTWGQLKAAIRARVFVTGEAPNLVAAHDKAFVDAIIDLQTHVACLQYDNTTLVPQCSTYYDCGLTVLDAPRGSIKRLSVIDKIDPDTHLESATADDDYCAEITYRQVAPCHIHSYLANSRRRGCCLSIPFFFGLPFSLCGHAAYPVPTDAGLPAGLPVLPLGFHYPQTSTDRAYGRSRAGAWAIERGKIYVAPWIQSTETIIITWDGIKRSWGDADPVDDDPLLAEAIEEWVRWKHADKFDKEEGDVIRAAGNYETARMKLIHQCIEETRVRGCEPSHARMSGGTASPNGPPVSLYYNDTAQSATASCEDGTTGDSVTVTIPAGTVASSVSVSDANQLALTQAEEQAQQQLVCEDSPGIFYNDHDIPYTASCQGDPESPTPEGNPVTIIIPAGTVSSAISVSDANAQALALAQQQASEQLSCTYWNKAVTYTAHCDPGHPGLDVTKTIPAHTVSSTVSQKDANDLALAQAQNEANAELSCSGGTLYQNQALHVLQMATCQVFMQTCVVQVTVNISAGWFTSPISQFKANELARDYATNRAIIEAVGRCAKGQCGAYQLDL